MSKYIISVSFGNYLKSDGGVDKAICDYQHLFNNEGIGYLHISPVVPGKLEKYFKENRVYTALYNGKYIGFFDDVDVWNYINNLDNKEFKCAGLHIHHTKKFNVKFIQKLIKHMNVPTYFFLHDYYSICRQPNLLYNGEKFCGNNKKENEVCENCKFGVNIREHIADTLSILKTCSDLHVVSPSELTLDIWKKTYANELKDTTYLVVPHQQLIGIYNEFPKVNEKIKIGFIGRYGDNKGRKQWEELVAVIEKEQLPYELYYLGFSDIPQNSVQKIYVKVDSEHPNKMLDEMRNSGINCAFMWSVCPETYSYAYFEAMAANLFVITNQDSGNIAYLVKKNGNGSVYTDLNSFIQELREDILHRRLEHFINDSNHRGPFSCIPNSQITELYGKDDYNYISCNGEKKVNFLQKKVMEYFYLKKNK